MVSTLWNSLILLVEKLWGLVDAWGWAYTVLKSEAWVVHKLRWCTEEYLSCGLGRLFRGISAIVVER